MIYQTKSAILFTCLCMMFLSPVLYASSDRIALEQALDKLNSAIESIPTGTEHDQLPESTLALLSQSTADLVDVVEQDNIESAGLYVSIGNAYQIQGKLGHAILAYRRAEVLDPRNQSVQSPLRHARSRVSQTTKTSTLNKIIDYLLIWRGYISRSLLITSFFVLTTLAWIFLSIQLLSIRVVNKPFRSAKLIAVLSFILMVLPLSMIGLDWYQTHQIQDVVILADNTTAYSGPNESVYQTVFSEPLTPGIEATLYRTQSEWSEIVLRDGTHCWVRSNSFEKVIH